MITGRFLIVTWALTFLAALGFSSLKSKITEKSETGSANYKELDLDAIELAGPGTSPDTMAC
jgi:hypothetical protein